jgi:hypothetical protein
MESQERTGSGMDGEQMLLDGVSDGFANLSGQCTTGANETIVAHYELLPEGSIAYRISGNNLVVRNRYAGLSIGE